MKPRRPLPPIPPGSPLRNLFPRQGIAYVPTGGAGIALMFSEGLYGSLAVSLPLLGTLLAGIMLSINTGPSPYGAHPAWIILLCAALFLAHAITFLLAARKVRRDPADPLPLLRAFRRSPWLLWFVALLLAAQYPWQKSRASLVTASIAVVLALLTHLVVWASLRTRSAEM